MILIEVEREEWFFNKINFCISLLSCFRENFLHIINILEFQPWRNEKAGDIWLDEEKRWVLSNGLFVAIFLKSFRCELYKRYLK